MARPNILWIMTDQFNAGCLSALGSQARTPHLDALAADGVLFERAYCNNPICAPSRVSFLTGQYCHTHGVQGNAVTEYDLTNPPTVSRELRQAGWRCGLTGKAHLPRRWLERDFEFLRFTDLCDAWPNDPLTCHYFAHLADKGLAGWYEEGSPRPGLKGYGDGSQAADLPYEYSIERYTGDESLNFLGAAPVDERPFFLKMSFQRPHDPIRPAREYFDLYDPDKIELPASAVDWFENRFAGKPDAIYGPVRARGAAYPLAAPDRATLRRAVASYYALITCIDLEIGRVIARLKETGRYDNTLIVFTADHGDFAGEHGLHMKNLGIYESVHRIPFILRLPGGPTGARRTQLIESVDLAPTLLTAAGLPVPAEMEGAALQPLAQDPAAPGKTEAVAEWSWSNERKRYNALRTETNRLVFYSHAIGGELYDLAADPGELKNLWADPAHAELRRELTERLFDRVNQYRSPSETRDDERIGHAERWQPRTLMHKRRLDWEKLLAVYETPAPVRTAPPPAGA